MSRSVNINKNWQFVLKTVEREALAQEATQQLDLPHTWNAVDGVDGGNDYYRGLAWYVKKLEIDTEHKGSVFLDFEGVNSVCNVYLNGTHLGRHEGGYSGFRFDITDVLREANLLEVAVDNSHVEEIYPLFADFTFYGGIYRDVNLIYTPEIHFEKMDLASSGVYVSQSKITHEEACVRVKAFVKNSSEATDVSCQVHWMDADDQLVLSERKTNLIDKQGEFEFDLVIKNPKLWNSIENPYLYNCVVSLHVNEAEIESMTIPTGLRYFEFDEEKGFFLNGKQLKLKGVSRHQDRAKVGNALSKEHQIEDMKLIKEIGANSIRLAHYQHSQFFYDLCDQTGMIVWAEIPYISKTSDTDPTAANAISQMRELIRQNYNHSSILLWGVQNEIGIMGEDRPLAEIAKVIHDVVKEEDTTRVTTQAQVMMTNEEDPAHYVTDTVAWNKYYGWYTGETEGFVDFIESFRGKNPNKAFGISEYGAEGIIKWHSDEPKVKDYSEEYHALYHEKTLKIFNNYDFIWGTYVWNMFDFGSDMRDEGGIQGMNNKGLITFDRAIKKDAFYWYQSMWCNTPMVHITSKRFVERHTQNIIVKVYSNLETVSLTHNGQLVGLLKKEGTIFYFNIQLTEGDNEVVATAGALKDHTVFKKVAQQNRNYVLPESESKKGIMLDASENVQNWFDLGSEGRAETLVFEYPKGMLSIKEPIRVILETTEGEAVLRKFIAPMFDHAMFTMIKGFSLEKIAGMQPEALPKTLLSFINQELILLKKQ
jgi:beta-galactosidase